MKKKLYLAMVTAMVTAMTACGSAASSASPTAATESGSVSGASGTAVIDKSENASGGDVYAEDGSAIGALTNVMHTRFFDYVVQNMDIQDAYAGYEPKEGNKLVVCSLEITNTTEDLLTMYDSDFQLDWSEGEETSYTWPTTMNDENAVVGDVLPSEYTVEVGETQVGTIIYEVPEELDYSAAITLCYQEYYMDENEEEHQGPLYVVVLSELQDDVELATSDASSEAENAED